MIWCDVRADEKDEMASADSVKFSAIFTQVESLHQFGMWMNNSRAESQFFEFCLAY